MVDTAMDSDRRLEKIRALLAKAETKRIPQEEAEAFAAKAQELMTKWAVDELQLALHGQGLGKIDTVKWFITAPHADVKIYGLGWLAEVHDCKVVLGPKEYLTRGRYRAKGVWAWVTGYEADLFRLQAIFHSLLVQCSNEMLRATKPWTCEVTEWRRGFIHGYFSRVTRLFREKHHIDIKEADTGRLLPILKSKVDNVEDVFKERWKSLREVSAGSVTDRGYHSGGKAAERADTGDPRIGSRKALGR